MIEIKDLHGNTINTVDADELRGANLRRANLGGADLQGANLGGANLQGADLRGADLGGAYLWGADLGGAYLWGANLGGANLQEANLRRANLQEANLRGADLREANLRGADLREANLQGANLGGANLQGADLRGADLTDCRLPNYAIIPQKGSFVGFKKVAGLILTLEIPAEASRVCSPAHRKCRAEFVDILEIEGSRRSIIGGYKDDTYTVGQRFYPDAFDHDFRNECSNGVHFFITREEAENY